MRKKYLFWGSIVVMFAYLWVTLGTMLALDASKSEAATTDVSAAAAVAIYAISQFTHRRQLPEAAGPEPTPTPAG